MLNLPDITLVALGHPRYKESQQKALDYSCRGINWGDVKNILREDCTSQDIWNKAIVFDLGDYIDTPYALLVHPDGYVVHPESWRDEFLDYDYVGAPWPLPTDDFSYRDINGVIQRVGNSVALRSKKLLDLPKKLNMEWRPFHGFWHEDGYIAVNMRHEFEKHGCKFAPIEVAKYFGREYDVPENMDVDKTFTFHKAVGRNAIYEDFEV